MSQCFFVLWHLLLTAGCWAFGGLNPPTYPQRYKTFLSTTKIFNEKRPQPMKPAACYQLAIRPPTCPKSIYFAAMFCWLSK